MPEFTLKKVPVVFHVQGNRSGKNTPDPIPGFEWQIVDAESGRNYGDPFQDQQKAEAACLKLNQQSQYKKGDAH